jgi:CBS domain containing-hemolysin-like protein
MIECLVSDFEIVQKLFIFSEIIPKTIGTFYWRKIAFFAGYTINIITIIMYPLVFLSQFFTRLLSKSNQQNVVSREEVVAMADIGSREGVFEEKESTVIQNMIHLKDKKVRDIMTPRIVISSNSEETTLKDFFEKKTFLQHSRILIYATSPDNITGYILKMDVLEQIAQGNDHVKLKNIKRNILVYYENFSVSGLFDLLMKNKEHIALIVDEFGNIAGIATMEDIIETLIGMEIVDERDRQVDMQQLAKEQWEERSQNIDI